MQAKITQTNLTKQKMANGGVAVGMIVRLMRNVEIAAIAKSAGFDCLYIDLEHCSFSLETVSQICMTAAALGVTPMVRVDSHDSAMISRTLEAGAQGVIVPHMDTAAQAQNAVNAAKFPPLGGRSLLGPNPHTLFRVGPAAQTMADMNDQVFVAGMIESVTAVENADAIAAVLGLDMLLVGTNDLCNSLGFPGQYDHPSVMAAYEKVAAACKKHNKYMGVGGLNARPDLAKQMLALGGSYVSAGSDTGFLMTAATATAAMYQPESQAIQKDKA